MELAKRLAPGMVMVIVSLVFFSQAFVMEKASLFDPTGGSFFPALISIVMLLAGISVIFKQRPMQTNNDDAEVFTGKQYTFILTFFVFIIVYVILLSFISFFLATFIFLTASMIYLKNVSWKMNILVSIGSVVVIYVLFSKLFHIIFP